MTKQKKLTAAQRIEKLENTTLGVYENFNILANDIDQLRQTVTALAKRLNATIEAGEKGGINNDQVNSIIIQENVNELKQKVDFLIEQGILKKSENNTVGESSFVVGRELDDEKNEINPRIQFAFQTLNEKGKELILDKSIGDLVKNEGNSGCMEITEIYEIIQQETESELNTEDKEELAKEA
jgi:hypothetical protein